MKKIFLSLVACAGLFTSCDMNTTQYGVVEDTTELDFNFVTQNRNYSVYSCLRGMTVGAWVYSEELQLDQFIGLSTNGARGMNMADGSINSATSEPTSMFQSCYAKIAQVNFTLEKIAILMESGNVSEDEMAELKRYMAECKFARAYYYFFLYDHFCATYTDAIGDEPAMGLQLVTVYAPTSDSSSYPGRSTQNETLELINKDLTDAFDGLAEYEANISRDNIGAGASYLSSYAVAALQARVALVTSQFAVAIDKADYVIGNSNYRLAEGEDYIAMWSDENISELIFAPYYDSKEISSPTGVSTSIGWNYWWPGNTAQCDYIPTQETVLNLQEYVDADGYADDARFYAFIANAPIQVEGGTVKGYIFYKYPGNPALNPGSTNYYINTPKPFRLSEQYLIKAEAAAMSGKSDIAKSAIETLVTARLFDPANSAPDFDMSASDLLSFIRNERSKELLGEGFRLSDLRRWKQGFNRNQPYDLDATIAQTRSVVALNVVYSADDYRYVWPIPYEEMNINPQLKGQQNPGY